MLRALLDWNALPADRRSAKPRRPRYPATVKRAVPPHSAHGSRDLHESRACGFGGARPAAHIKLIFGQNGVPGEPSLAAGDSRPAMPCVRPPTVRSRGDAASSTRISSCMGKAASLWAAQGRDRADTCRRGPGTPLRRRSQCEVVSARGRRYGGSPDLSTILEALPRQRASASVHRSDGW